MATNPTLGFQRRLDTVFFYQTAVIYSTCSASHNFVRYVMRLKVPLRKFSFVDLSVLNFGPRRKGSCTSRPQLLKAMTINRINLDTINLENVLIP